MNTPEANNSPIPALEKAPTCYRHPQRETWVSCGRCGKPLCADCVKHGPVGVRCAECLRPPGGLWDVTLHAPEHVKRAVGVALGVAVVWIALLCVAGVVSEILSPNLLITGIAGSVEGWLIWRLAGRAWNRTTVRWATMIGLGIPLAAGLVFYGVSKLLGTTPPNFSGLLLIRIAVAALIGSFFAWLFATKRRGPMV